MRKLRLEKELRDNAHLLRAWKRWHAGQLEEVLAGPHAVIATQVVHFLKTMTPASANALLALMRGQTWASVDANTKFVLLHELNQVITRLREGAGLAPIDDALPGERPNAFLLIKDLLFPQKRGPSPDVPAK
jgi:hypothetical protein